MHSSRMRTACSLTMVGKEGGACPGGGVLAQGGVPAQREWGPARGCMPGGGHAGIPHPPCKQNS